MAGGTGRAAVGAGGGVEARAPAGPGATGFEIGQHRRFYGAVFR